MNIQQSPYEKEIRRISEVLAKVGCMHHSPTCKSSVWAALGQSGREGRIAHFMDFAPIVVTEMAKQYEFAYFSNYHGTEDSEDYALWNENCISEMKERGLIT